MTNPLSHPVGCETFRRMNSTYDLNEQQSLWEELRAAGEYLGCSRQNVSYYSHKPEGSEVTDYYCRWSTTQMEWLGTDEGLVPSLRKEKIKLGYSPLDDTDDPIEGIKPYTEKARASGPYENRLDVLQDIVAKDYYVVMVNCKGTKAVMYAGPFLTEEAAYADIDEKVEAWWVP